MKSINKNIDFYKKIQNITDNAEDLISNSSNIIRDYSELLNEYWDLKKKLSSNVSNPKINSLINYCKESGAEGSKLLGAGNGGFLMSLVKPQNKKKFLNKLQNKLIVPIQFENLGSQIVYYSENENN
jgi:D-glycero-alpha-D-manno-heptose-7-phosphate kinase